MHIDVTLAFDIGPARLGLLSIEVARADGQTITSETLKVEGATLHKFAGDYGIGRRFWAMTDTTKLQLTYSAQVAVSRQMRPLAGVAPAPLHSLTEEHLPFLRPSRYCQSDLFADFTAQTFGALSGGDQVAAIADWIASNLAYTPGHSGSATTAVDTFQSQQGVCRDYTHLFCALARAAQIPARYVSAYGIDVDPPDFHAVVQVWLENGWHMIDPTGMCTPDQIAIIGIGRDAGDLPFLETSDDAQLLEMTVKVR